MSAVGITQTVLATQLLEAIRNDYENAIDPFNLDSSKIENGAVADWIRMIAKELQSK